VNQKLLFAALTVLLVVMVVQDRGQGTRAAEPAGDNKGATYPVAMLDVTKIFKQHDRFADRSEKMKQEVTAAEQELKGKRAAYQLQAEELERLKKGTAEYERLAAEMATTAATLIDQVKRQKEAFLRQEAAIYLETYEQVQAALHEYAGKRGIKLVLRFNGDPIDRTKPDEVLQELKKSVLYQDGIDITNDILEMLNGRG